MKATKQIIALLVLVCICSLAVKLQADTFYLRSQPQLPYPSDPYSGTMPIIALDASNGVYQVQDTATDFLALEELVGTNQSSGSRFRPLHRDPSSTAPYLEIATDDDNYTQAIQFDTTPGFIYNVEESTDLLNWTLNTSLVANDTNYIFTVTPDEGQKFFRAVQADKRLSFPNWDDYVEAFAYFNIHTTIQGTYHLELYADGNLLYQTTAAVPTNGNFGVYDAGYDSSQWPNVGGYAANEWALDVTVTPSAAGATPAHANLTKKQRHLLAGTRRGLTVEMELYHGEDQIEVDQFMLNFMLTSLANVSRQIDLAGQQLNEFTSYAAMPKLLGVDEWTQFKTRINDSNLTDLHYFGHGSHLGIGENLRNHEASISLAEFQNATRKTYPLKFAEMDGCTTASSGSIWTFWQNSKLLEALCGYDKKVDQSEAVASGKWVRFAWGWKTVKVLNIVSGGHLNAAHFNFSQDFYNHLADLAPNGLARYSYDESLQFALHPMGHGVDSLVIDNTEGYFSDYLGCGWGYWFE